MAPSQLQMGPSGTQLTLKASRPQCQTDRRAFLACVSFLFHTAAAKLTPTSGETLTFSALLLIQMDEALAEQQRAAYKMPGVDDEEPALDPSKKRKAAEAEHVSPNINSNVDRTIQAHLNDFLGERKESQEREAEGARQHSNLHHFSSQGC